MEPGDNANDYRNFEFHPLPGETLTLDVTRPEVAPGAQQAIDAVNLHSEAGQHASTHVLDFTLRASQGGDQRITLPTDAEVLAVTRDNQPLNLRALDGKLTLPVVPGTHRYSVRFHDAQAISMFARTPALALGLPAANISIVEQLPGDRWLLAAWGPAVGPAVLYWGELIVMILVAYALARTRRTRLRFREWLLLGLGFSTFSWFALLVVRRLAVRARLACARCHAGDALALQSVANRTGRTHGRGADRARLGDSARAARPAGHARRRQRFVCAVSAVVRRSQRRRAAAGSRDEPAAVGIQGADAGMGVVARQRA